MFSFRYFWFSSEQQHFGLCVLQLALVYPNLNCHTRTWISLSHISRCHYTKYTIHLLFGSLAILTFSHLVDFFLFLGLYLPPALTGLHFDYPVLFTRSLSLFISKCVYAFALSHSLAQDTRYTFEIINGPFWKHTKRFTSSKRKFEVQSIKSLNSFRKSIRIWGL